MSGASTVPVASRLDGIQVARAIAALGVVLFHSAFVVRWLPAEWRFEPVFPYVVGFNGVFLFFVISGFIIAKVIDGERFDLRGFVFKRFFRIYPLYWGVTLLAVALEFGGITFGQHGLDPAYIRESLLIMPMAPPQVPFFSLGWTLEHEIVFYAVAALAGAVGGPRLLLVVVVALGLGGAVAEIGAGQGRWNALWTWHLVDYHMLYFATGVGLYLLRGALARLGMVLPFVLSCLALSLSMSGRYHGGPVQQFAVAIGGLALWSGLLCVALVNLETRLAGRPRAPAWPWRALVAIGNWSYSLYLVHYLVMRPAEIALLHWDLAKHAPWAAEPIRWGCIGLSLLLAAALFRWVETPLIDLGQRLARRTPRSRATEIAAGNP